MKTIKTCLQMTIFINLIIVSIFIISIRLKNQKMRISLFFIYLILQKILNLVIQRQHLIKIYKNKIMILLYQFSLQSKRMEIIDILEVVYFIKALAKTMICALFCNALNKILSIK